MRRFRERHGRPEEAPRVLQEVAGGTSHRQASAQLLRDHTVVEHAAPLRAEEALVEDRVRVVEYSRPTAATGRRGVAGEVAAAVRRVPALDQGSSGLEVR